MMKKIKNAITAFGLALSLLLTGCASAPAASGTSAGGAEGEPVTIRFMWWGSQTRHDQTIQMIEMFMEQNPDIIVEYEYGGFDTYWDKITSMMAAGNAPDVFQNSVAYILSHAENDQLLDLNPYIESGVIDLSKWDEVSKTLGAIDGKTYGLTMGNSAQCMLYDPAVFEQAGLEKPTMDWTWDDYHAALKQIQEKTGLYGDSCYPASLIEGYVMKLRQNGYPGLFTQDRTQLAYTDTDLWVEYFTDQKELIANGYVMPYDQTLDSVVSPELSGLATGTAGMLGIINSNQAVAIANAKGSAVEFATFPHAADETQPGNFISPTMFYSVPKTTQHPEETARFINFMLNDVEANKIALMERGIPANSEVRAALEPMLSETAAAASKYVGEISETAVPFDNIYPKAYGEILDLYKKLVEDMMFDRISIEEGAQEFNTKAAELLAAQ